MVTDPIAYNSTSDFRHQILKCYTKRVYFVRNAAKMDEEVSSYLHFIRL